MLTLGCSKNVVDSERIISLLSANGLRYEPNADAADAVIVNTCGFIKSSKEESVRVIFDVCALKRSRRIRKVVVTGCFSERYGDELADQINGVDLFFGVNAEQEILRALVERNDYDFPLERKLLTPKHYAYLKISDGCNHQCAFCAIPGIRGKYVSTPVDELRGEAQELVRSGVRELNVIAQDTTYYGRDLGGASQLPELLESLSSIEGLPWLRLLYAYPTAFPDRALEIMAERANICKYIDIPLQHISDRVLKSMGRGITGKQIYSLLEKIRKAVPGVAIRTSLIVGFPTEQEKDFEELKSFVGNAEIDRLGVFMYSREDSTPAFGLGDPIDDAEKLRRADEIMELQQGISLKKNREKIGKKIKVLIEGEAEDAGFWGRSEHDAPEIDNAVLLPGAVELTAGQFVTAEIYDASEYDVVAKVIS